MNDKLVKYGQQNTTFLAAGGEEGIRKLVDDFYDLMASEDDYKTIIGMHPKNVAISRDKLSRFLCGWMGGPPRYNEKYGPINIPMVHAHLPITGVEMDQWLACMQQALDRQPYPTSLIEYLMKELAKPAERIRLVCGRKAEGTGN